MKGNLMIKNDIINFFFLHLYALFLVLNVSWGVFWGVGYSDSTLLSLDTVYLKDVSI